MEVLSFDIVAQLRKTSALVNTILNDRDVIASIERAADTCVAALHAGNKLLFAGNGGSAADAQHMAGEYVSRFMFDRPGLSAIALTTDTSILTAIGNDYGYEKLFSRQISALGRPGDVFFAYSTSGDSPNIVAALAEARQMSITTIGMTGSRGGKMDSLCDLLIRMPSAETPIIQEGHLMVGHSICASVEAQMFGGAR